MPGGGSSSSGERVTITILRTSDASKVQVSFDSVSFLLVVDGHRLGGSVTCRYYLLSLTYSHYPSIDSISIEQVIE